MQHALLTKVQESQMRKDLPVLRIGDTLKVHVKIREGEKERIQIYEGTYIARNNSGVSETITVRKLSFGVGVERTFPVHSPIIQKIEPMIVGDVRRAKLYYLRDRVGKAAKIKEKRAVR